MLIIRRRVGESLFVGENIEIEVLDICGGQIKIGIHAPREIVILRSEVRLTAEANRLAALHSVPTALTTLAKKLRAQETQVSPDKHN